MTALSSDHTDVDQQFEAAFEYSAVGMALLDTASRPLRVNRAVCNMFGYTQEELLSMQPAQISHPADLPEDLLLRAQMLAGADTSYQREKRYLRKDGRLLWVDLTCSLVRDAAGQPVHFIVQLQDITKRRAAEAALRESEERFRDTFEQAALGIAHIALDGRMLRVNKRLCEMHGYSCEELLALNAHTIAADGGSTSRAQLKALLDGGTGSYTAVRHFIRKTGERYPARVSVTLVRPAAGEPYLISIVEDLTRHTQDQRHIEEMGQMLDHASDAIIVHELDRRIRYWNQGAERLFGWRADEAVGRKLGDLLGAAAVMSDNDKERLFVRGEWTAQVHCRAADGRMLHVERRLTLMRDDAGQPSAVLSVNTDVTQRRQAEYELQVLNNALEMRIHQRTQQLEESNEELRNFAYSLAHDLRAPLGSIDGFSSQLQDMLAGTLEEKGRHYLARVRAGVRVMADLTDALLALAHLSQAELLRQSVDLSAIALAWQHRVQEQEPGRDAVVVVHGTPRAVGDVRLLADMLENLLGNAWKFSAKRAGARIEFGSQAGPQGQPVYYVRDNGAGFDPAYVSKLFMPFQRLHAAHEFAGTGIGLAIVRKIVSRHGGRVWAESGQGEGAVFYFTLSDADPSIQPVT